MFCPKCGVDNADTNKFCHECGLNLTNRSQINQAAPNMQAGSPDAEPAREYSAPATDPIARAAAVDLSLVFEDAEQRLDEILVEVPQARKIEQPVEAIEEPPSTLPDPSPVAVPSFMAIVEPERRGKLPSVMAAIGVILLLAVIIGGVFYFYSRPATEQTTKNEPPPANVNTPVAAPAGMALVPGGDFLMGSDKGDEYSRPAHRVTVKPFYMDVTEVTNEEYKKFIDATHHKPPPDWKSGAFPDGKARFPVTGVNWEDANAYTAWAKKRLPTEEEWEFAARGTDGRLYPWGEKWDGRLANAAGASHGMREVGHGGSSPFGIFDMTGNAWEWTANDTKAYPDGKKLGKSGTKIIRGGNWESIASRATTVFRGYYKPTGEAEYNGTGIRCVRDVTIK